MPWAAGTGTAALLVASAYLLANLFAGPLVITGGGEVTLRDVIGFTALGGTLGAALAYAIDRFAQRPRLTFVAVSLIALAVYAVVPFTAAESIETAVWLNIFHVVVAIPVIGMLTRYLPRVRPSVEA
jgi:hypothetical protein